LVFSAWPSRFGIEMEVYYTRCLIEGHPCLVAFAYGSDSDEGLTPTKDGGTCLRRLSMFRKEVH